MLIPWGEATAPWGGARRLPHGVGRLPHGAGRLPHEAGRLPHSRESMIDLSLPVWEIWLVSSASAQQTVCLSWHGRWSSVLRSTLVLFLFIFVCGSVQDHSNEDVQLGVTSQGLAVFQNHVKTNTFTWYTVMFSCTSALAVVTDDLRLSFISFTQIIPVVSIKVVAVMKLAFVISFSSR